MNLYGQFFKFIAVDFDGTLCTDNYPGVGVIEKKHLRVIKFIREAKAKGSIIILNTCREGEELKRAVDFCKENDIPIDYVNENPLQDFPSRKLFANIYIDDRAISVYNFDDDVSSYVQNNIDK